jgi:cell division septum initiation protein DivIVA
MRALWCSRMHKFRAAQEVSPLNDSWMKGRARELQRETLPKERRAPTPSQPVGLETQQPDAEFGAGVQQQALEMLTLAQRTAEEHVAGAQRHADKLQEDARAAADQIVRDAQAQADAVRREAEQALAEGRARAAELAQEAQAHAETARREGEKIVADARTRAADIGKDAEAGSKQLMQRAELRYEEMVGNLAAKREALQQQIEALQAFDRDYRSRLLAFMQGQVRALWVDERQFDGDNEQPATSSPALPGRNPDTPERPQPVTSSTNPPDDDKQPSTHELVEPSA